MGTGVEEPLQLHEADLAEQDSELKPKRVSKFDLNVYKQSRHHQLNINLFDCLNKDHPSIIEQADEETGLKFRTDSSDATSQIKSQKSRKKQFDQYQKTDDKLFEKDLDHDNEHGFTFCSPEKK